VKKNAVGLNSSFRLHFACYAVIALPVLLLLTFLYFPICWAVVASLNAFELGGSARYVGLSNYGELLAADPVTWPSVWNVLLLTLFAVCTRLSVPLVVAKLIHTLPREGWRRFYRFLFLIPMIVPDVVIHLIWGSLVLSDSGAINSVLRNVGLSHWATAWLSDPDTALLAVAMVGFPFLGGVEVLIYYAGLCAIPESIHDSARLEGCTGLRKFFHLDIPLLMSQTKILLILIVVSTLQGFEDVFVLTGGGPGFRTMLPGLWMYFNAFSYQRMGYACAIGVCIFVVGFALACVNMKYLKSSRQIKEMS
jgi:raffinose/stachyose/melibiose transport system permease protein